MAEPMSEERLTSIETEHADPHHYEEDTACVVPELIAEVRRLRAERDDWRNVVESYKDGLKAVTSS